MQRSANSADWCYIQFASDAAKHVAFCDVNGLRTFCAQPANTISPQQVWRFDIVVGDEGAASQLPPPTPTTATTRAANLWKNAQSG